MGGRNYERMIRAQHAAALAEARRKRAFGIGLSKAELEADLEAEQAEARRKLQAEQAEVRRQQEQAERRRVLEDRLEKPRP